MKLKITYENEPTLHQPSLPVEKITQETRNLISNMFDTMYANNGVGLAAPQVGVNQRIIVIDTQERKSHPIVLINPEITDRKGEVIGQEGCLSCPKLFANVKRAEEVTVTGFNEEGSTVKIRANEILAVALQHEIDHLDGVLFLDRLDPNERIKIESQRQQLK